MSVCQTATAGRYAANFAPDPHWRLLTGTKGDVDTVLKAFDALYPSANKMYHQPYTFLRADPARPWVRIEGMLSGEEMVAEFGHTMAQAGR